MTTLAQHVGSKTPEQWYTAFEKDVEHVIETLDYLTPEQVSRFREACFFMYEEHKKQNRKSGEPYAFHPLSVAAILSEVKFDVETLIAGLLHDVIEDVKGDDGELKWTAESLAAMPFVGKKVAEIVEGVTKIQQVNEEQPQTKKNGEALTIIKTILATNQDIRVIMVKLADRLHNLRTMAAMSKKSQRKKARQTLAVYAPLAARLGMETLRLRLTELSYQYAYPLLYQFAKKELQNKKPQTPITTQEIAEDITVNLRQANVDLIKVTIHEPLVQHALMDLKRTDNPDTIDYRRLIRVIVKDETDCYKALGVLHKMFRHRSQSFSDCIWRSGPSGYRSLDTRLFGKHGSVYDAQIRTQKMHLQAQTGAAGALLNASLKKQDLTTQNTNHHKEWISNLVNVQKSMSSVEEFYQQLRADLLPTDITVYSPTGEAKFFVEGATAIDFAYSIHTDIGNTAVKAVVNGRIVRMNYQLKDGDKIKIITNDLAKPGPSWERFATTAKARGAIRHYFNHLEQSKAIKAGRKNLDKLLKQLKLPKSKKWPKPIKKKLLTFYDGIDSRKKLYETIGRGQKLPTSVADNLLKVLTAQKPQPLALQSAAMLNKQASEQSDFYSQVGKPCQLCKPVPGDAVLAIYSAKNGMVIHYNLCKLTNPKNSVNDDFHMFKWHDSDTKHSASLTLEVEDKPGVLAEVCKIIADEESNIVKTSVSNLDHEVSNIDLEILVYNTQQLAIILTRLQHKSTILEIHRNTNSN